ncbi:hypothetical protein PRIPAC_87653, partial [Pristionchus pacificus]
IFRMSHTPKNVIVTGACGFIGSNFMNYIFRAWNTCNFVNVDKLILNSDTQYVDEEVRSSPRYKLELSDIKNEQKMLKILEENEIDTIIHFAADCTSTRCYEDTTEAVENNVVAFVAFLETVRRYGKLKRFLHISTDEVYGDSGLGADENGKNEQDLLLPGNPYAATKICGEAYAQVYRTAYGLPIVIARINNIYGPNQWDVKVVPRFIEIAKVRGNFTIQGSGKQLRSWLFVDDAARGIQAIAESGVLGDVYNLGTYFEMNVADLAHAVQKEVDTQLGREHHPPNFISIPDRPYNDLRYLLDISKADQKLGWQPTISFEEGLRRTVVSALRPKEHVQMGVVIFGGRGYVGQELQKILTARKIPYHLATTKPGTSTDEEVEKELVQLGGTHVVCCTGRTHGPGCNTIEYLEGGPEKTSENVRDNMFSVNSLAQISRRLGFHHTYIGTAYIFAYDEQHPVGGKAFKEDELPTFFGSSYSVVKGYTDRQMEYYNRWENINARITLPLTFDTTQPRNLLTKIVNYKELLGLPVSLSILPDCLGALVDLMAQRYQGNLNLVNPGPLSLYEIVKLYKEHVNPAVDPVEIAVGSERCKEILATKGNCALDTTLLQKLCPSIPSTRDSLVAQFKTMKA